MDKQSYPSWVKPNPELKNLEVVVGEWDLQGAHPLIPTPIRGRASFEWLEGGDFLAWRTNYEQPGPPSALAVIGRDDSTATYSVLYYDQRGVSRIYEITIEDNVWKMRRDAPGFQQRMTFTISDDRNTITVHGELSEDGSHWKQDLDLSYTRTR